MWPWGAEHVCSSNVYFTVKSEKCCVTSRFQLRSCTASFIPEMKFKLIHLQVNYDAFKVLSLRHKHLGLFIIQHNVLHHAVLARCYNTV